jgi:hypothetical protein
MTRVSVPLQFNDERDIGPADDGADRELDPPSRTTRIVERALW